MRASTKFHADAESARTATVTGMSFKVGPTGEKLLLVLDIAEEANPLHTIGLCLRDSTYVISPTSTVLNTNFPICNTIEIVPVELASFSAAPTPQGITLYWRTASEVNTIGFNIYRSEAGQEVSSGIYFYRLNAGAFTSVRKMVVLK
ncbi:MAG: hypothetical protein QME66_12750 [Candidatus Eisenbacteria bacterium]|nr:hypothetical protein [Candidatus Eisenbacteria bacterium]